MIGVETLLDERCARIGPFPDRPTCARASRKADSRATCRRPPPRRHPIGRDAIERAAIELLHEASLVHDDICDAAAERRGAPSVVAAFGIRAAALTAAFFAGHALSLMGGVLERRGLRLELARLTGLVGGQILECIPSHVSPRDLALRYEKVATGRRNPSSSSPVSSE